MKSIYMKVQITNCDRNSVECTLRQIIDGGDVETQELSLEQALRMMWELKLAGGTKRVWPNRYCPSIIYREVTYWACH